MKHIGIIGSGIVGKLTAFLSSLEGHKVLLFGKTNLRDINAGSYAAPAMVNVVSEITAEYENSEYHQKFLEIGIESSELWPVYIEKINQFATRLNFPPVKIYSGMSIQCDKNNKHELSNFQAITTLLKKYKISYSKESPEQIPFGATPESKMASIYIPFEKYIESHSCLRALDRILDSQENIQVIKENVQLLNPENNSYKIKTENGHDYTCDTLLIAAGYNSQTLLQQLDPSFPKIYKCYGMAFSVPRHNAEVKARRTVVFDSSCGIYTLDFPNYTYYGATGHFCDEIPSGLVQNIRGYVGYDQIPFNKSHIIYGIRGFLFDKFPIIGALQTHPTAYCAVGLFRHGFTFAPYIAKQFLEYLKNNQFIDPKNIFTPGRKIYMKPKVSQVINFLAQGATVSHLRNPTLVKRYKKYDWLAKLVVYLYWLSIRRKLPKGQYYDADSIHAGFYQGFPDDPPRNC